MSEKAVLTADGKIILFILHGDMTTCNPLYRNYSQWEPYFEPAILMSGDGGCSWNDARQFTAERGRVWDVLYNDGLIYILFLNNPLDPSAMFTDEHHYQLYVSADNGETFELRSRLTFTNTYNCYYGTMGFLADGLLIVYSYDEKDEYNLKYIISGDEGRTWQAQRRAHFAKKIRNPQLAFFGGEYFIHGRSGSYNENNGNFILYNSQDGVSWDEGTYLRMMETGIGAYSNNLVVGSRFNGERNRLMIHTSHAYKDHQTNTIMFWLDKRG